MRDPSDKCCCQPLLDEFQRSKFSLEHDKPADFCRSQWQRGERSIIWLIYRWLLAAFFAAGVITNLMESYNGGQWFIYLTDWGFTLCFFTCTYGAVIATIYYIKPSYFESGSWALKIYWGSHFATTALALMISAVFWILLYPILADGPVQLNNLWAHAFNSAGMFIDFLMVAFPTRPLHFIYPLAINLIYGAFSLVYYWSGGTDIYGNHYIYPLADWEKPGEAIGFFVGSIAIEIVFCFLVFFVYRLRTWMYESCRKSKPQEIMRTQMVASTKTVEAV